MMMNKTIKIIDLLNKIANDEEVPKKIKFRGNVYVWFERHKSIFNYKQEYCGRLIDNYFCDDWFIDCKDILDDEAEIIEGNEKIKKIDSLLIPEQDLDLPDVIAWQKSNNEILKNKLNKIIDEINKIEEKINE